MTEMQAAETGLKRQGDYMAQCREVITLVVLIRRCGILFIFNEVRIIILES